MENRIKTLEQRVTNLERIRDVLVGEIKIINQKLNILDSRVPKNQPEKKVPCVTPGR